MTALRRYVALLAPYRRRYAWGLLLLFLTNALALLVPWLVKGGVDALARRHDETDPPPLGPLGDDPWAYVAAIVVVGCALAVIRTGSRVLLLGAGRRLARDLKDRLYQRLLRADPTFYARYPTGDLMNRCTSDVQVCQALAAIGVLYSFEALFVFGIAVPYMFSVSIQLTALLLIPFPFLALLTMWAGTQVKTYAKQAQQAMSDLTSHLSETLQGMPVVKAYTLERHQGERFAAANDRFLVKSMHEAAARGAIQIATVLTGGCGTLVILAVGGRRVAEGTMTYGDLALFLTVLAMVIRPTVFLGWVLSLYQRGMASVERLDELFDAAQAVDAPAGGGHVGPLRGEVEVRSLSYRYPEGLVPGTRRQALEDVSLKLAPGASLGLLGRIGCGKTTLLRSIPRFIAAPPGAVLVDGVPVERWDLGALRGGIGYVPQDGAVFSLTLGANVAFGRPDASHDEVMAAVRAAALDKDLDQLQCGLETVVGERGVTLSGGQRQRLALARALLLRPRLLVLDDALSMVDAETAVAVLKNLRAALPGTTLIAAAHRTATLFACDEVAVLEGGRLVERGPPRALAAQRGSRFGRLHEQQRLQSEIEAIDSLDAPPAGAGP